MSQGWSLRLQGSWSCIAWFNRAAPYPNAMALSGPDCCMLKLTIVDFEHSMGFNRGYRSLHYCDATTNHLQDSEILCAMRPHVYLCSGLQGLYVLSHILSYIDLCKQMRQKNISSLISPFKNEGYKFNILQT